jgi:branched-chain amino acid transport system ATP-binding protein
VDNILELKGITRRFGGLIANKDVSFDVTRGEILGLIGPNGAGKSTLFNQIAGLYPPTSGRIIFNGTDITNRNATDRCGLGIARTFQVVRSFDQMSVLSNVLVGALVRNKRTADARLAAYRVLEFAGLADRADVLASDLTSPEKRRLEFARALATEPKLLLLDEVLTGLTPTEAKAGVELIRRIKDRGITIVMVEHVMEIVMPLVDRAIVLDLGQVIAEGSPQAVVSNPRVVESYLGPGHA